MKKCMHPSFPCRGVCAQKGACETLGLVAVWTRSRAIVAPSASGASHADERPGALLLRLVSAGRCCLLTDRQSNPSPRSRTKGAGPKELDQESWFATKASCRFAMSLGPLLPG